MSDNKTPNIHEALSELTDEFLNSTFMKKLKEFGELPVIQEEIKKERERRKPKEK